LRILAAELASAGLERVIRKFETPEEAEAAIREDYRRMTPNERVAVTVALQRAFYSSNDPPRRLSRLLTVVERP
jgi:hypothetical protein